MIPRQRTNPQATRRCRPLRTLDWLAVSLPPDFFRARNGTFHTFKMVDDNVKPSIECLKYERRSVTASRACKVHFVAAQMET